MPQDVESLEQVRARFSKKPLSKDELPLVRWVVDKHLFYQRMKQAALRVAFWITTTGGVLVILEKLANGWGSK